MHITAKQLFLALFTGFFFASIIGIATSSEKERIYSVRMSPDSKYSPVTIHSSKNKNYLENSHYLFRDPNKNKLTGKKYKSSNAHNRYVMKKRNEQSNKSDVYLKTIRIIGNYKKPSLEFSPRKIHLELADEEIQEFVLKRLNESNLDF